jgi:hypothetical protein
MASQKPVVPLQDMKEGEREEWIKKAPVPVRQYIWHLEEELAIQDEMPADVQKAEDFDQALAALWTHVAFQRTLAGDEPAARRAFFAAGVFRVD